jgi:hypothetical protein|tara:strand:+ start:78 stop:458 length:381 start_codon:yes stop_codon:yes gene_type:complete
MKTVKTKRIMENKKNCELEFIISYNKKMYESENPDEYCMELVQSKKYNKQSIFSFKLPKTEVTTLLENPLNIVEYLGNTDKLFFDIWKVSMCVYNGNGIKLPKWYDECDGKLFHLEELFEEFITQS